MMRMMALAFVMLGGMSAVPSPVPPPPTDKWHWIRIEPRDPSPGQDAWLTRQGTADLTRSASGRFATMLWYDGAGLSQHYRLTGTIRGQRVSAREILEGSDAAPLSYQGSLTMGGRCLDLRAGLYGILLCKER